MKLFRKKKNTWDDQISDLFFQNATPDEPSHQIQNTFNNPKKNRNTILTAVALACIMIAIVAFFAVRLNKKKTSSGKNVPDSFVYTNQSVLNGIINFDTPITEYLGTKDVMYAMSAGYASVKGDLSLDNIKNAGNTISGMSLSFDLKHNAPDKIVVLNSSLMYRGEEALAIQAYLNTEALYFKVPKKSDKLYSVSFGNLRSNLITNSMERSENEIDTDYVLNLLSTDNISKLCGDWTQFSAGADIVTVYLSAIKKTYPKDYQTILDNIIIEDAEADNFGNPGKTYTITETGVETFVKSFLLVTLENEELYNRFYPVLYYLIKNDMIHIPEKESNENNTSTSGSDDSNKTSIATAIDDLLYDIQSASLAFAMVYSDSLSFTAWFNNEGMLVGLRGNNDIRINNNTVSVNVIAESRNEANPIDNSNTVVLITYGEESFQFQFSRRTERNALLKSYDYISFILNNQNKIEIHSTQSLDTSDNEYEHNINIISSEDSNSQITLTCLGNFSNIVKGNSFDFHIENLYINEGFSNLLTSNGNLSINTNQPEITKPTGETKELTEMSSNELAALLGFSVK